MNVWGFKRKAKLFLELERDYEFKERAAKKAASKYYFKKKADQFRGIKEFYLRMIRLMAKPKVKK